VKRLHFGVFLKYQAQIAGILQLLRHQQQVLRRMKIIPGKRPFPAAHIGMIIMEKRLMINFPVSSLCWNG